MRGFRKPGLTRTNLSDSATECSSCSGGATRTAGQEDTSATPDAAKPAVDASADINAAASAVAAAAGNGPAQAPESPKEDPKMNDTYVMRGPAGHMITAALLRSRSFQNSPAAIAGHAGVAVEELAGGASNAAVDSVFANGMVDDPENGVVRLSRAVGVIPMPGETPTALNTMIDAMGRVEKGMVDFIMINNQKIDPPAPTPELVPEFTNAGVKADTDGLPVGDIAIESIEVIVRYKATPPTFKK